MLIKRENVTLNWPLIHLWLITCIGEESGNNLLQQNWWFYATDLQLHVSLIEINWHDLVFIFIQNISIKFLIWVVIANSILYGKFALNSMEKGKWCALKSW